MASRVNTKFVLVTGIMLLGVVALIAALFAWRLKADASRNIRKGDELVAAGDLDKAWKYYGRALHKEPGRKDYLQKLEGALLLMQPQTSDEATERYLAWTSVLRHDVQHHPNDPAPHLRLIEELHKAARLVNRSEQWALLDSAAFDMWERVPPTEPDRAQAKVYRGLARARQSAVLTREEIVAAEEDLGIAVEMIPDSDIAWAALVTSQLKRSEELNRAGQTRRAQEMRDKGLASLRQALVAVPEGTEVAKVNLLSLLGRWRSDAETVSEDDVRASADHLVELIDADTPDWSAVEAADLLRLLPGDGRERAVALLENHLAEHPDSHQIRFLLARMHSRQQGELDVAHELADAIIVSEPLTVGLLSRMQFELKRQAAGLIVDIEQMRWEQGDREEQDELVANIEAAVGRLETMVVDPATDPILLRAEGKLAFAKKDYRRAANMLEAVVNTQTTVDPEIRMYLATSLQRTEDKGRALEHLTIAASQRPSASILYEKGRLEFELGRLSEAAQTVAMIQEIQPDNKLARRLADLIEARASGGDTLAQDPVIHAVQLAQKAAAEGDFDTARATLEEAIEANPESVVLMEVIARIEIAAERKEAARQWLTRAIELQPGHARAKGLLRSIDTDDPIDSLVEYYRAFYEDKEAFDVAMATNMPVTARSYERRAARHEAEGNLELAEEARRKAERASLLAEEAMVRAKEVDPDEPELIEFEFMRAITSEDWTTAERLVLRAVELDLDQAEGLLYRGRLELFRKQYQEAVRTLETATAEIPYSAVAWRTLGVAYQSQGNFAEAVRAFEEAYLSNPSDLTTVRQYVSLLDRTGDTASALGILRRARTSFPDNAIIQEAWLTLEAKVGSAAVALRVRSQRYDEDPENSVNAARLAALLGQTDPTPELIFNEQGELRFSPQTWARFPNEAQQQILGETKDSWNRESDEIIATLIEADPDNLSLQRLKASVMRSRGDIVEGEDVLRAFIERLDEEERTAAMFIALGDYQSDNNRYVDAEASYLRAKELQDDSVRDGDGALAKLYFTARQDEKAIEALNRLIEVNASRPIRLRLVEAYSRAGRYDEAEQELERVVDETSAGHLTKMLEAAIALGRAEQLHDGGQTAAAQRYFDEQRIALAEAQEMLPSSPMPQIVLAQSLLKEHRRSEAPGLLDDALVALERADEIEDGVVEARMIRAEINREMGREGSAVGELDRLVSENPAEDNARRSLMQYYLEQDSVEAAIELARRGAEESRSIAYWNEVLGDMLALRKQDYEESAEAYAIAFELRRSLELLSKLADVKLAVDEPDYQEVLDLIEEFPAERRDDPIVSYLLTKTLVGLNRRDEAEAMARTAYDQLKSRVETGMSPDQASTTWFLAISVLFPPDDAVEAESFVMDVCDEEPDAFILRDLAELWASAGSSGMSRAIELQLLAIDGATNGPPVFLSNLYGLLAQYQFASGDMAGAEAAFAKAIELNPDDAATRNNYAYLLAEHLDRAADALVHAQRAAELKSDDASMLDTLGWVEFKMGDYDSAERHLLESVRGDENATTLLHLAHVQFKQNDLERAGRNLVRAAELRPDPETKAEIERLADDIRTMKLQDR